MYPDMFKTQYDPHDRVYQHPGDPVHILYSPQFDKDGNFELVESGREDIYSMIQSHAESVDLHLILERYARGDVQALSRTQGVYMDTTGLPETYAGMLNTVIAGERQFNELPLETRAKFDFSFEKWMASMDDMQNWSQLMGLTPLNNNEPPAPDAGGAPDGGAAE